MLPLYERPFTRIDDLARSADALTAWSRATADVAAATDGKLRVPLDQPGWTDESYWISIAATPPACNHALFTWRYDVAGFCWNTTPTYYVADVTVDPMRIHDVATATRALLYGHGFGPHSMPGLMNRTSPASTLSEFERKTLHMVASRWPLTPGWPDDGFR
jgi:hypothetical protein